jgi:hypothetical protein
MWFLMHVAATALGISAVTSSAGEPLASAGTIVEFIGTCDASAAVVREGGRFIVGDDEDNVLRVYDSRNGGVPLATWDLSGPLALAGKKKAPEIDIEAATEIGGVSLWLASHGRDSKGRLQPSRLMLLGTRTSEDGSLVLVGRPYRRLVDDLIANPALARLGLAAAAERAPKEPGGLNIEGMTALADGRSVLIGFRNPVPGGRALAITLQNPLDVLAGAAPRLGEPLDLDLAGLGVRAISWWRGAYLFLAGAQGGGGSSRLFTWSGVPTDPPRAQPVDFHELNPEAFVTFEDLDAFLVLSDDGSRLIDGVACKKLKDPSRKRFRGMWIRQAPARTNSPITPP